MPGSRCVAPRFRWTIHCLGLVLCWLGWAQTAAAGIFSGVVESVSAANKTVTIRIVSSDKLMTFRLGPTATITLDSKSAKLDQLQAGQTASITTVGTSTTATRITARAGDDAPSAPVATTKPAPMPTPKAAPPPTRKTAPADRNDTATVGNGDWPQFRGPLRDNISREAGLLERWPDSGPELLWTQRGFGEGYSSVSIAGDTIYTMGTRGDDEMLFALDRESGTPKWATRTGNLFREGAGNGPRGTPTVDGDRVYALGAHGDLVCVRAGDGGIVWQMNILQTFGGDNIVWGICESVLIDGDKLICTPGGRQATMVALNKLTGNPVWRAVVPGTPQTSYASAIAIEVGNVKQYVNFVSNGVVGVRANDGTPLWGQRESANGTANCSTPVFMDNAVFSASGYGTGGALFRLASRGNSTASELAYTTQNMKNHHGGMVLLDGHLYGFDEQILTCLDIRTGRPVWQNRSVGKGSLTCADGKLFLRGEGGPVALAEASPAGYQELGRFDPPRGGGRPAWAHPVVAGGRLYLRDQDSLYVYSVR